MEIDKDDFEKLEKLKWNSNCKLVLDKHWIFKFENADRTDLIFNDPIQNNLCPRLEWTCGAEVLDIRSSQKHACELVLTEDLDTKLKSLSIFFKETQKIVFCTSLEFEMS